VAYLTIKFKEKQMYKVITHTIKEEHFTHPRTVEYALLMKGGNVRPMTSAINDGPVIIEPGNDVLIVPPNSGAAIGAASQMAVMFRGVTRTLLEKYVYALRNAIVSIFGTSEDLIVLEEEIKKSIANIESAIKPYYDSSSISLFAQKLTEYTTDLLDFAKAQKEGKSFTDIETRLAQRILDISDLLPTFNPAWNKGDVSNYFTWFGDAVKRQIAARKAKNWAEDQIQFEKAYQIFVSGLPDWAIPFAQYLARGIITQYPGQFR
jgi:hypothetical protein